MELNDQEIENYVNILSKLAFNRVEQKEIIKQMYNNKYLRWLLDDAYYRTAPDKCLIALRKLLESKSDRKNQLIFSALKHVPFAESDWDIFYLGLNTLMEVPANGENDVLRVITDLKLIAPALKNDIPEIRYNKFALALLNVQIKSFDDEKNYEDKIDKCVFAKKARV